MGIALSGIQVFEGNPYIIFIYFIVLLILFVKRKKQFDKKILVVIFTISILYVFQALIYSNIDLISYFGILTVYIFIPYYLLRVTESIIFRYYLNIIYFHAILSLFFWTASNFIPGFFNFTVTLAGFFKQFTYKTTPIESFIIFNVEYLKTGIFYRNAGPFHEPGAFSVFLTFALVLNIIYSNNLFNKKAIILIIALITTFSTAGYLSLMVYFTIPLIIKTENPLKKLSFLIIFIPITIYIFQQEFVSQKLFDQFSNQSTVSLSTPTSGRFLGARKALVVLERNPIFGRGLSTSSRPDFHSYEAAGYGWITWVSRLGLIAGIFFLFYFSKFFQNSVKNSEYKSSYIALVVIVLFALAGQKHTSSYIFLAVFFAGFLSAPSKKMRMSNNMQKIHIT